MGRRPVTVRLARWSAEHPWRAIALWAVFVAVCFVGGNAAGLNEATNSDQAIGEAGRASLIVDAGDFADPAVDNVLITSTGGALDQAAAKAAADDAAARLWPAVLRPALRAPVATLVISVGLLLALAAPALGMKLKFPGMEDLPRTTPAMQAYDRLTAAFPSAGTNHVVAVRAPADQADRVHAALTDLSARAAGDPLFAPAEADGPKIEVSADRRVTVLDVPTPYASRDDRSVQSLEKLRGDLVPAELRGIPGIEYAVGGGVADSEDYAQHVRDKLPLVMGFVLVLTFLVMAFTFRSVVIAASSIALNLLSAGAAYGLLVLVFQGEWAQGLLGFTSMGAIVSWLPLFLFVVLFGLSMDYHVFVVSRIREGVRSGLANRDAVSYGITSSAGVVTSAAIVMVGVFSIFATLSTIDMKQLGIGLAAAILLDATIIRGVVLPALMTMLGDANWWAPRFLRPTPAPAPTDPPPPSPEPRPIPSPPPRPARPLTPPILHCRWRQSRLNLACRPPKVQDRGMQDRGVRGGCGVRGAGRDQGRGQASREASRVRSLRIDAKP
ncbi:MMPL family transporter [Micromonospora sp. M51]|uniref:MMPL family transporter n=1 Tax=Micromonospora sp. M51 TaxID=2824889 RepID=UPI001FFCAA23|nr:MMPL family transporter [Micromonospora sp. M51]